MKEFVKLRIQNQTKERKKNRRNEEYEGFLGIKEKLKTLDS